jgi:hypothetical protein
MTTDEVKDLGTEVTLALRHLTEVMQERDLLRRVLKQAILTHGGDLRVDPELYEAATSDKRSMDMSAGGVRLI